MSTLQINGTKIAYDDVGQGEPLLLIHGIYCSRQQWGRQVAAFENDYRVITCDLRGHGQSAASAGAYSIKLFAEDLLALLDELGLEKAICCGHSFGGLVAQELALSYPERVRGLILAETMYGLNSTPWEAVTTTMLNLWLPQMFGTQISMELAAHFFGMYTPGSTQYIQQEAQRHLTDSKNQQNILRASLAFDSRWRLQNIDCPTLLLVGQYPHIPLIIWQNWEMYWRIRQAKLTFIPNAGHLLFWDNPTAFNEAVGDFIQDLPK